MLGKAERTWRTLRDNASAMLHGMSDPKSMRSCAISTVVYLRNRMYSRAVGASGGVAPTLLTSQAPDASKFCVFGCTVCAKVPDKLRRKLGEKAFRGIIVGYPPDAPGYRTTTSVHVVFLEDVPGFSPSVTVDSPIFDAPDMDSDRGSAPQSHPYDLDPIADEDLRPDPPSAASAPPLSYHDRPSHLWSHPIRYGELVAHLSDHPRMFVATCCEPEEGKATKDIVAQPDMATLIDGPPHVAAGATPSYVALMLARDCVEPTSDRAALTNAQAPNWQTTMQHC
jgi:hypothetical protein